MQDTERLEHPLPELDRPRTVQDLADWLNARGERVSAHTIWRWIREGRLPVAKVGRATSTARAYFDAKTPRAGGVAR